MFLLCALTLPSAAEANAFVHEGVQRLSPCAAKVAQQIQSAGLGTGSIVRQGFILESEARSFGLGLGSAARDHRESGSANRRSGVASPSDDDDGAGCIGLLALGHQRLRALQLQVHDESGQQRVRVAGARPYARVCGIRGGQLHVTLTATDGRGEFQVLALQQAPQELPQLRAWLQECAPLDGLAAATLPDVGPEPKGPPIWRALSLVEARLEELGYKQLGETQFGHLKERRREGRARYLVGGRCYSIAAVGDSKVVDLDLRLFAPSRDATLLASDVSRGRDAVVKICPQRSGQYLLDVRMYQGSGNYALRSFVLAEPNGEARPSGVQGLARILYAELVSRIERRGMVARPLGWGLVPAGNALTLPVQLEAGRCYALGGVPADEIQRGDLDLALVDGSGTLLAWDVGRGSQPLIFHCAKRSGTYRTVASIHGNRDASRYLVVLGQSQRSGSP